MLIHSLPAVAVLSSCALLGFRHGFDYDHIAAIADIAGVRPRVGQTMRLGLMYALGHAATITVLGSFVVLFGRMLPPGMDRWAERLVGATLIVFAVYVLTSLLAPGTKRPVSRAALLIRVGRWLRSDRGQSASGLPPETAGPGACFAVGVLHGVGAETPSQLGLYLLAAGLGGVHRGMLGLALFLVGMLSMNTLMCAVAAGAFRAGKHWDGWQAALGCVSAVYSFGIGLVYLFGWSSRLTLPLG